jgi:hypothetical protein
MTKVLRGRGKLRIEVALQNCVKNIGISVPEIPIDIHRAGIDICDTSIEVFVDASCTGKHIATADYQIGCEYQSQNGHSDDYHPLR